ncbi:spore coat protein [Evansella sp. LMS18]|uniref:spore coat protein n=1 Tax=Evansella sp. LMS18 TaxID=2924033 RepID=UPI0020D1A398|nr:spore coat protein [Evansella sp. LMS18]UTR10543.1 spore coat protein [Evansella sp. LMS18]
MTNILQNLAGMAGMTDQVIATDFLISSKATVKDLSFAVTEAATPELRSVLRTQLKDAIVTHELITNYMIEKGYYHPNDIKEQIGVDLKASKAALKLAD